MLTPTGSDNFHLPSRRWNSQNPTPHQDDSTLDGAAPCGSMSGNFIFRHHVEPRVKLYSPREESFPIPLKYIDVTRTTHTSLGVLGSVLNEEKNKKFFKENRMNCIIQLHFKKSQREMMRKLKVTSGLQQENSFIVITLNPESNCTCRKKKYITGPVVGEKY